MSIYGRLGFNYDDPNGVIVDLSDSIKNNMNNSPHVLEAWQIGDIANNNVNSYTQNPLSSVNNNLMTYTQNIVSVYNSMPSNTIYGSTSAITTLFSTIKTTSINLANNAISGVIHDFKWHTDRLSDVRTYQNDLDAGLTNMDELPYYQTATGIGKAVSYIIYQSDEVQNTSGVMGSFTSLFTGPQLNDFANNIINYSTTINNSITLVLVGGTGGVGDPYVYQANSNLSLSVVNSMSSNLTSLSTMLTTRKTHDENFYKNSIEILNDVRDVRKFSKMGASETTIVNDYIGTNKLKSRINS